MNTKTVTVPVEAIESAWYTCGLDIRGGDISKFISAAIAAAPQQAQAVDERKRFEKWAVSFGLPISRRPFNHWFDGEYEDPRTHAAWNALQSYASLSAQDENKDARLFRKLLSYEYWHRQELVRHADVRQAIEKAPNKYRKPT